MRETQADARRFFAGAPLDRGEQSYLDRQYVDKGAGPSGSDKGIGFDRVELCTRGELVDRK